MFKTIGSLSQCIRTSRSAKVWKKDGVGAINLAGDIIIKPQFQRIERHGWELLIVEDHDRKLAVFDIWGELVLNFHECPRDDSHEEQIFGPYPSKEREKLCLALEETLHQKIPPELDSMVELAVMEDVQGRVYVPSLYGQTEWNRGGACETCNP